MSKKKHKKHKKTSHSPVAAQLELEAEQTNHDSIADSDADSDAVVDADVVENDKPQETEPESSKKSKRFPVFYAFYILFVAVFAVVLYKGIGQLNILLSEYESVQPEYAAEELFEEYFKAPDIAQLMEMSSTEYAVFETHDRVVEYLNSQIEGKEITFAQSSVKEEEALTYNVFCDGARFAVFSMEKGSELTPRGFSYYKLKDVKLTFSLPENAYNIVIPENYTLSANGRIVDERFVSGEPILSEAYALTSGKYGVRYFQYRVDGFLSTPQLEVRDRGNNICTLAYDEDNDVYSVDVKSVAIKVPAGYTAYIGDYAIGVENLVADSTEPSAYNEYLSSDATPLNYVSYSIGGFIDMPDVSARSADGAECAVSFDSDSLTYVSLPVHNDKMRSELENMIFDGMEKLTLYLQYVPGTTKEDVRAYFDTSSEIWSAYASIPPQWNYEAESYRFEDKRISDFIVYDENYFSCRVSFHYIGRRGSEYRHELQDKVVFYKKYGNRYYICNMVNGESVSGLGVSE